MALAFRSFASLVQASFLQRDTPQGWLSWSWAERHRSLLKLFWSACLIFRGVGEWIEEGPSVLWKASVLLLLVAFRFLSLCARVRKKEIEDTHSMRWVRWVEVVHGASFVVMFRTSRSLRLLGNWGFFGGFFAGNLSTRPRLRVFWGYFFVDH